MTNPTISGYEPIPSLGTRCTVSTQSAMPSAGEVGALAVPVVQGEEPPAELGADAAALASAGFTGARGQTLVLPHSDGVVRVAVGVGPAGSVDTTLVRDLAAEFARAVPQHKTLAVELPGPDSGISAADYAQAVTEGVILARWHFHVRAAEQERTLDTFVRSAPTSSSPRRGRERAAGRRSRTPTTSGATCRTAPPRR